jgi:2-furoyl-CoA dehydrogenase large subunit
MSTPVCIANAVADALGMADVELPLVPARLAEAMRGPEMAAPSGNMKQRAARLGDRKLSGEGCTKVAAAPEQVWAMLLDPETLAAVIPGCHGVKKISDTDFKADVTIGVGPVKDRYRARVSLSDLDKPNGVTLEGTAEGALGFGAGKGRISLAPEADGGTSVHYRYEAEIGGKIASIGGRLLDGAARVIIGQFFAALARQAGGDTGSRDGVIAATVSKLRGWLGGRR